MDIVHKSVSECLNNHISHQFFRYFEKNGLKCHYIGGETSKRNPEYDIMFRFTRNLWWFEDKPDYKLPDPK
jgi:phosphoribosylaminoimidazole-succinocarboxamide synthase